MAEDGGGGSSSFPAALAGAVALLVAALAAIGLSGDSLARAVRVDPDGLREGLVISLIGAAVFAGAQLLPRKPRGKAATETTKTTLVKDSSGQTTTETTESTRTPAEVGAWSGPQIARDVATLVGVLITVYGVARVVGDGTDVSTSQELPLVSLQSAPVSAPPTGATGAFPSGSIEITVGARAVQMDTNDDFEVQVLGLKDFEQVDPTAIDACEKRLVSTRAAPVDLPTGVEVLMWTRVGPKADGSVDQVWKLQAPAGEYAGVCAWGSRTSKTEDGAFTTKDSAAYLELGD